MPTCLIAAEMKSAAIAGRVSRSCAGSVVSAIHPLRSSAAGSDPAAFVNEVGIKAAKSEGEMHLANVAQGTVKLASCHWLPVPGRPIGPTIRVHLPLRLVAEGEALQLKLPDVLRKNGDKPEATVGSKVKELAMAAGKGFATEAGKLAASGLLSFVINWIAGGGAAKG